ncbi:MAG: hypothetical protein ACFB21_08395 [Opitutales bacterium]
MQNFAEQCTDIARSILANNLDAINEDGTIQPVGDEASRHDEPGHAALAIGEYYRLTQETQFEGKDLIDLTARAITAQAFAEEELENGLAYAALGLLSFGPAKERNPVWERLLDPTRETLDQRLLQRTDYDDHLQAFNVAKAVARFSLGLSKKDETGRLIDRFVERLQANSSQGYHDDHPFGIGGAFDVYGILSFVFIRQALQLHGNVHLRERKLPSLRTHAVKYLKLLPDLVRDDGLGFAFGRSIGAYGQMHCISLILQAIRDEWIDGADRQKYNDLLRRLFQFFFSTYLDQEHGYLIIRDHERQAGSNHTTRIANFDAARYLCQWSRLAQSIGGTMEGKPPAPKRVGRFVLFDKSSKKEQGLFVYRDPAANLHFQVPLVAPGIDPGSNSLAFPHMPGIIDWPSDTYVPILQPELTIKDQQFIPSYYGMRCTTGLGMRQSMYFRYEQPEFITREGKVVNNLGSVKVSWSVVGGKITAEFTYQVRAQLTMQRLRFIVAVGAPHSTYRTGLSPALGAEGQRPVVLKDDFQAEWAQPQVVNEHDDYRTFWGNLHYLQILERKHPLIMRPGQQYRLHVEIEPDITLAE